MALLRKKAADENLGDVRDIADDVVEQYLVPYACHWNEDTLVTKNGQMVQTIKIAEGDDSETSDLRTAIREAIQSTITKPEYAVWVHVIRRRANFQAEGEFKRDFSGYLDKFWRERNHWDRQFTNEVYITIVKDGEDAKMLHPVKFVRQIIPRVEIHFREKSLDKLSEELSKITNRLVQLLSPFGAKKLGIYKKNGEWFSAICGFLGRLVSLQGGEYALPQQSISDCLTRSDVAFGFNAMEARSRKDGSRRFGAYISFKDYREVPVSALNTILKLPMEFIISQCFEFTDAKLIMKDFVYQKQLFDISGSAALANRSGLLSILESNQGEKTDYCKYQLGVMLIADSMKGLDSNVSRAMTAFGDLGIVGLREDIFLEECYWAMLPANFLCLKRLQPLNTSAMAGLVNLDSEYSGKADGNHWGPAVTTFNTINGAPYFFNFHTGSKGHAAIVGPPDSGKKVLLNFLLAQSRKFEGRLVYFDRKRASEPFIRSIEGAYYTPGANSAGREYAALSLNPLQMEDSPQNRTFLSEWLGMLLRANKEEREAVESTIAEVMGLPKQERGITSCASLLEKRSADMAERLKHWMTGGKWQGVFGDTDTLNFDNRVIGIDMDGLVRHEAALEPVFYYIMQRLLAKLDSGPAIVVWDEAWELFRSNFMQKKLTGWLDALEQKNAMAILASEQIDAVMASAMTPAVFSHVATKIFLPDDSADSGYETAFGIAAHEVPFIAAMNTEDRHFLVAQDDRIVVLGMDLSGMVDIVSMLDATTHHLQLMEQAIAARGISPSQWMPRFLETL